MVRQSIANPLFYTCNHNVQETKQLSVRVGLFHLMTKLVFGDLCNPLIQNAFKICVEQELENLGGLDLYRADEITSILSEELTIETPLVGKKTSEINSSAHSLLDDLSDSQVEDWWASFGLWVSLLWNCSEAKSTLLEDNITNKRITGIVVGFRTSFKFSTTKEISDFRIPHSTQRSYFKIYFYYK